MFCNSVFSADQRACSTCKWCPRPGQSGSQRAWAGGTAFVMCLCVVSGSGSCLPQNVCISPLAVGGREFLDHLRSISSESYQDSLLSVCSLDNIHNMSVAGSATHSHEKQSELEPGSQIPSECVAVVECIGLKRRCFQ